MWISRSGQDSYCSSSAFDALISNIIQAKPQTFHEPQTSDKSFKLLFSLKHHKQRREKKQRSSFPLRLFLDLSFAGSQTSPCHVDDSSPPRTHAAEVSRGNAATRRKITQSDCQPDTGQTADRKTQPSGQKGPFPGFGTTFLPSSVKSFKKQSKRLKISFDFCCFSQSMVVFTLIPPFVCSRRSILWFQLSKEQITMNVGSEQNLILKGPQTLLQLRGPQWHLHSSYDVVCLSRIVVPKWNCPQHNS